MNTRLHHTTCTITPGTLETTVGLFELLGCTVSYRDGDKRWCMIEQKPLQFDIQLIEVDASSVPPEEKKNMHIAFLSDAPQEDIAEIKKWAREKKLQFSQGQWSNKELWFDFPDIFTNFVVEILHTSVED